PLEHLRTLLVNFNQLSNGQARHWINVFASLPALDTFGLANNSISGIPAEVIPPSMETIDLRSNPLGCCTIIQLRTYPSLYGVEFYYDNQCYESEEGGTEYTPLVNMAEIYLGG
ncbi:hypothetical protein SARC_17692, partial [Sphaeroforma arctica JP610]